MCHLPYLAYKNKIMYVPITINEKYLGRRSNLSFNKTKGFCRGEKTGSHQKEHSENGRKWKQFVFDLLNPKEGFLYFLYTQGSKENSLRVSHNSSGAKEYYFIQIYFVPSTVLEAWGYSSDQSRPKQKNTSPKGLTFWWRGQYGEDYKQKNKYIACQILIRIMKKNIVIEIGNLHGVA